MPTEISGNDRTVVLACEGLRTEMDWLAKAGSNCPSIVYVEQGLHDQPDQMREELNRLIRELEREHPKLESIILGYGLCGKGLCGVTSERVRMVVPRVHDCVPLYVGTTQANLGMTEENSGIFWFSAGMLEYGRFARHIVRERHALYKEKFGEKRAERMIRAENSLFSNYKGLRYVRWPEMKEEYAEFAKATAEELSLPYDEIEGNPSYLGHLLYGDHEDEEKFLVLEPGESICMDTDGKIIKERLQEIS